MWKWPIAFPNESTYFCIVGGKGKAQAWESGNTGSSSAQLWHSFWLQRVYSLSVRSFDSLFIQDPVRSAGCILPLRRGRTRFSWGLHIAGCLDSGLSLSDVIQHLNITGQAHTVRQLKFWGEKKCSTLLFALSLIHCESIPWPPFSASWPSSVSVVPWALLSSWISLESLKCWISWSF